MARPLWRSEDSFVHWKGAVMEQNRATIASFSRGITTTSDQPGLSFAVLLTWIRCPAAEMATLAIERDPFHGEGNYTISPNQQPP